MYQILIILFIILAFLAIRHIRQQPPEMRGKLRLRYGLYCLVAIAVLLVLGGKLHWIAGAIAAVLPLAQRFFPLLLRALPFLKNKTADNTKQAANNSNAMPVEKALQIFGFTELPSKEVITHRHKELMQKNHPDRGGSDFLAAQINQAKDVLLAAKKSA